MHKRLTALIVCLLALGLGACASSDGGSDDGGSAAAIAPPADSKLAQVTRGMMDTDVRRVMGDPSHSNAYMTGKAWIPFYFGSDTRRSDWIYAGQGRVVFSRNQYTGGLKVIKVIYNPAEE
jgi:outer membrane protein assembly factor BamE (lipoprotein component of BamABCDE complex)